MSSETTKPSARILSRSEAIRATEKKIRDQLAPHTAKQLATALNLDAHTVRDALGVLGRQHKIKQLNRHRHPSVYVYSYTQKSKDRLAR